MELSKIADAMQIDLHVIGGKITGEATGTLPTPHTGLKLPLHFKAVAMFRKDQTGVLFKGMGDLYVLVAHNPGHATSLYLIDAANCTAPEALVNNAPSLKVAVTAMSPGICAAFYRTSNAQWAPLKLG